MAASMCRSKIPSRRHPLRGNASPQGRSLAHLGARASRPRRNPADSSRGQDALAPGVFLGARASRPRPNPTDSSRGQDALAPGVVPRSERVPPSTQSRRFKSRAGCPRPGALSFGASASRPRPNPADSNRGQDALAPGVVPRSEGVPPSTQPHRFKSRAGCPRPGRCPSERGRPALDAIPRSGCSRQQPNWALEWERFQHRRTIVELEGSLLRNLHENS